MKGRAALVAIVALVVLATAGAALMVRMTARAIDATAAAQAAEAPDIARFYIGSSGGLAAAAPTIVKHVARPGLHVVLHDAKTGRAYGERGVLPPRRFRRPPNRVAFAVLALTGEEPRRVPIPGGELVIAPSIDALVAAFRTAAATLVVTFALGAAALSLYARGVRRDAMRPLRETTVSLQRLAERDFTPRTVVAGSGSAYEDLAHAYNRAVEAVAAAFAERRVAEIEMQRFIADAGHELRTPLTIVMGYLDLIEGGALSDSALAGRIIGGMRTESLRMRKLIDKLIVLARMETPSDAEQRSDIDVVSLVARVIESLEPIATQRITIDGVPFAHVYANEDDIADALTNIIENAIKYAPRSDVRVTIERSAGTIRVAVADRGPGMTADEMHNAFERFFRGERRGDIAGSGLGLAIAKRAVERAGGTIAVESVSGVGTTFTVALPDLPISVSDRSRLARR